MIFLQSEWRLQLDLQSRLLRQFRMADQAHLSSCFHLRREFQLMTKCPSHSFPLRRQQWHWMMMGGSCSFWSWNSCGSFLYFWGRDLKPVRFSTNVVWRFYSKVFSVWIRRWRWETLGRSPLNRDHTSQMEVRMETLSNLGLLNHRQLSHGQNFISTGQSCSNNYCKLILWVHLLQIVFKYLCYRSF